MGYYRRIDVRMWGDRKFRALPASEPSAQLLWVWLLTNPWTNALGMYEVGEAAAAEKLGWPLERYRELFAILLREGLIDYCQDHRVILIRRFLVHNPPHNANVLKGWWPVFDVISECHLKREWIQLVKQYAERYVNQYGEWFDERLMKPFEDRLGDAPSPSPSPSTSYKSCGEPEKPASPPPPNEGSVLSQLPEWFLTVLKSSRNFSCLLAASYSAFWDSMIAAYDTYDWLAWDEQVTKADCWIEANPTRRPRQMSRFLRNWFEHAVEAGRKAPHATSQAGHTTDPPTDPQDP